MVFLCWVPTSPCPSPRSPPLFKRALLKPKERHTPDEPKECSPFVSVKVGTCDEDDGGIHGSAESEAGACHWEVRVIFQYAHPSKRPSRGFISVAMVCCCCRLGFPYRCVGSVCCVHHPFLLLFSRSRTTHGEKNMYTNSIYGDSPPWKELSAIHWTCDEDHLMANRGTFGWASLEST